eukprot:m.37343 g.37343  ORF g.37343 m.37343 type:complete len:528 (-) comp17640_c0_seq1:80-1663(-)
MAKSKDKKKAAEEPQFDLGADADPKVAPDPNRIWRFPWEDDLEAWIGRATYENRKKVESELRTLYMPKATHMLPLYSDRDWNFEIKQDWNFQFGPEPELAVQLITSAITPENAKNDAEVPKFIAASIRRQRGVDACKSMYDNLKERLAELDNQPSIEVLRELYTNGVSTKLEYAPRSKLMKKLVLIQLTQGGATKESELDLAMRTYRDEAQEVGVDVGDLPVAATNDGESEVMVADSDAPPNAEETPEAKLRRMSLGTQIKHLSVKELGPAKKLPQCITEEVQDDKAKMKQYAMTEKHILAICDDDNLVIDMFLRVDLNANKELGFSEMSTYFNSCFPVLKTKHALQIAFRDTNKYDEDPKKPKTPRTPGGAGSISPRHEVNVHSISVRQFRTFLKLALFYGQLAVAFEIMDWHDEEKINRETFGKGLKLMKKFLKLTEEELDFDLIVPEGHTEFTYTDMCRWMKMRKEKELTDLAYDELMKARELTMVKVQRMLDVDSFTDLLFLCHYTNRVPQEEFAFEKRTVKK